MGARVSTINDWLRIKIGGDDTLKKKKKNKKLQTNRIKSTKYTLITFLPQNLIEQFRRIANFYFLVMTIISLLIDSPVSPMTSLLPLVFVIAVTATKQGCEDYLRYKTDCVVNCSPVTVIREGKECNIECQNVEPGDLVVVSRDCDVPCDLVLLKSSDPHGKCFVTTANLDGESNLKTLTIPRGLPNVEINQMHKLGIIECEFAKTDLYSFNGKIELGILDPIRLSQTPVDEMHSNVLPLSAENVLLRGSRVKNTECVIGCAVYTGMTTKLALNSRLTRNKSSSSEVYVNRFLIFILIALIFIVTFQYFMKRYNELFLVPKATYLGAPSDAYSVKAFLQDYLSFLILYNYLIPISLYVTIEMFRVLGGFFMEWDLGLYDEPTDQHCIVNTSNLNEELGHVNILFSDKTGTLTKNEMIFQQCSISGKKYLYKTTKVQEESSGILLDINKFNDEQKNFFQGLSICHTVQVAGNVKDRDEPKKEPKTKRYSISDITEESQHSSQQSDIDTSLSTNPNGRATTNGTGNVSDINPLLDETVHVEKRKRPEIVKRSPRFARATSRVHPLNTIEMTANGFAARPSTFPLDPQNATLPRPTSLPFKRSTSEVDLQENVAAQIQTHRRTQSYGSPSSNVGQQVTFVPLKRTPSTASRASYAMPNYISRQPSALIRAESMRRKNEIQNMVEMLDYQASSPDEKALVEACANLGLVFLSDDDEVLKVRVCPPHMDYTRPFSSAKTNNMFYDRLHVLEFTSDRKRMSVIVKDENGTIWIYTKGAESYVFPLCATSSSNLIEQTDAHISDFAKQGLRTLAVARKRITPEEYKEFVGELNKANASLENRKHLSEECYAKIERNLDLLGATAVEDALQDDVADTLVSLQKAGIKIWVLTGDKVETALNIALSCGHIPADAMKYFIVECTKKEDLEVHLDTLEREIIYGLGRPCALLIEGKSLTVALKELPDRFRDVTIQCQAVLCCRLSPLQKSEVVSLIKSSRHNYITAAIGDGANDVSMIQEAHVGVGIIGKEGRQAARCADFALARFNMLKRLLLVHGHYHTARMSLLVLYFFYKNIVFMGIMFLFQFHCMFSSQPVYDSWFLTLFNVVYTSLPIFFISLTEKPYMEDELMNKPELYIKNINNKRLQWPHFMKWILFGIYHSVVAFYFTFFMFSGNNILLNIGQPAESAVYGTVLIQMVVIIVNLKLWLETKHHTYWYIVTIWASIIVFMITTVIYNVINLQYDSDMYWSYNHLFCSLPLWLLTILSVIACLLPDYTIRVCRDAINMPKRVFYPGNRRRKQRLSKVENSYL